MYVAPADASLGQEEWRPFVTAQGFGHLVAAGQGLDYPVVVPTQFVLDGTDVLAHFAASEPDRRRPALPAQGADVGGRGLGLRALGEQGLCAAFAEKLARQLLGAPRADLAVFVLIELFGMTQNSRGGTGMKEDRGRFYVAPDHTKAH